MMSSETACFNGYAEEFLEVQMADAMPLKLFTDCALQGMERPIVWGHIAPLCSWIRREAGSWTADESFGYILEYVYCSIDSLLYQQVR